MKRRNFGLLAGTAMIAINADGARAQSAAPTSALGDGLTPLGSEQAGNTDGSIPPWTGGMTTLPLGVQPGDYVPELFPNEQPVLVVDSSSMTQHAAFLSEGTMALMTRYGFTIKVYPTHRTAALPKYIYDNIAKNKNSAKFVDQDPVGGRFGFKGAFGGVPFPVPDISNPLTAGAQIIWNHNAKWWGYAYTTGGQAWSVSDGQKSMAFNTTNAYLFPYYDPDGQPAGYNGKLQLLDSVYSGPTNLVGQAIIVWAFTNPFSNPQEAWELLNGQGRVRRAPEVSFDTPATQYDGIANYDETYGFNGSLERYDWKYIGKQEMYIPYNNNRLSAGSPEAAHLDHFLDPNLVRWEKHRCWIVEATLHPGERNVLARRRFYVDEDTWGVALIDAWDANNELYKVNFVYNRCLPALPGVVNAGNCVHNLQTDDYVTLSLPWNQSQSPNLTFVKSISGSVFDPEHMAAEAQY